jgi:D-beta-D-heptose 7-phosphate kinase/D-beta-D-heptose 1-phosphate adenosyltransferase
VGGLTKVKSTPTISSPIEGEGKNDNDRERLLRPAPLGLTFRPAGAIMAPALRRRLIKSGKGATVLAEQTFQIPTEARVRELLAAAAGRKILVVGDLMLDAHLQGRVGRISPEAPVPVFEAQREERTLGGAANVARNLAALGVRPLLVGMVGNDAEGDELTDKARAVEADVSTVIRDPSRPTTLKTRIVSRSQQILRIDREDARPADERVGAELREHVRRAAVAADVIVLSDYGKGVLTSEILREIAAAAVVAGRSRPILVDPIGDDWERYVGAALIKPNLAEAEFFCGFAIRGDDGATAALQRIRRRTNALYALLTRGEAGMALSGPENDGQPLFFPARSRTVFDVTGAGDTSIAVLATLWASGATPAEAAWTANLAAGISVTKFGAVAVSDFEILEALAEQAPSYEGKVLTKEQAAKKAAELRRCGKKVVFTNGCFDLLHLGHVAYLEQARREGDALFVGVNTDDSIRRLKGPGRPVVREADRARVLGALACVNGVILFAEDTPHALLEAVRPDVLCKGGNYDRKEEIVGWDAVESWGGRATLLPLVEGRSTSKLIEIARARDAASS